MSKLQRLKMKKTFRCSFSIACPHRIKNKIFGDIYKHLTNIKTVFLHMDKIRKKLLITLIHQRLEYGAVPLIEEKIRGKLKKILMAAMKILLS